MGVFIFLSNLGGKLGGSTPLSCYYLFSLVWWLLFTNLSTIKKEGLLALASFDVIKKVKLTLCKAWHKSWPNFV